ncbi:PLD nuclease N-terminal domain-containing protein [Planomonospora sp. ID82291]|uniref:PLD nuclease N-terminal domain-containing protein n=1 Tax=Planomonospora sp. ID82291 TaxID=2738136 RepID=UPI0018C450AA|nr:PLD nuclease N-terminal domain-containing protein [Planomonospora sp. ID82291]MBG0817833.1 PLDc_N domain-containing protein [Planomonospora sp. ID82291]
MTRSHRRRRDLSGRRRAVILTAASIELSLTATAAADLWRRPAERVRGRKALWWPLLLVQPFGPIAYLVLGRVPSSRWPGRAPGGRAAGPAAGWPQGRRSRAERDVPPCRARNPHRMMRMWTSPPGRPASGPPPSPRRLASDGSASGTGCPGRVE